MIRRIDAAVFESTGSLRGISIMRVLTGAVVLLHLKHYLRDMGRGIYYGDSFHVPYLSWYPELPRYAYWTALSACAVAAVMMILGVLRRPATWYVTGFVAYDLFLSKTNFHHNRALLLLMLIGLSLASGPRIRSDERGPLWPIWWMRLEHSLIFFASGFSKLIDPDWLDGTVMLQRVIRYHDRIVRAGVPDSVIELLNEPTFHYWVSKAAIATELFIAIGLWFGRTRLTAIWVALIFHISIEVGARVQVFGAMSMAAMLLWVTPQTRSRRAIVNTAARGGRRMRLLLRYLDWLARFEVETVDDPSAPPIDVDGATGSEASFLVLTRLPAVFFFVWPASGVARVLRWLRPDGRQSRS